MLLAVVLAAGTAWVLWRQKRDQVILFDRLPGENLALLHLDVGRLRQAAALAPLLRARVDPDPDYSAFVKQTGFDYQRDLDAAAICYLPDRVYLLARGRFDPPRLRQYALAQGGRCAGTRLDQPCSMPASQPGRAISFLLLSPRVLALATAPEADAVKQLETAPVPSAESLAKAATAIDPAALLWATATPASLDQAVSGTADLSPNLALFSRSLAGAQRAFLVLKDQAPNLGLSLKVICTSEAQAADMRRLWQGLNDFIGGLMRGSRRRGSLSAWDKVFASAVIQQEQNTVRATWTLDPAALESLGSGTGEQ